MFWADLNLGSCTDKINPDWVNIYTKYKSVPLQSSAVCGYWAVLLCWNVWLKYTFRGKCVFWPAGSGARGRMSSTTYYCTSTGQGLFDLVAYASGLTHCCCCVCDVCWISCTVYVVDLCFDATCCGALSNAAVHLRVCQSHASSS